MNVLPAWIIAIPTPLALILLVVLIALVIMATLEVVPPAQVSEL